MNMSALGFGIVLQLGAMAGVYYAYTRYGEGMNIKFGRVLLGFVAMFFLVGTIAIQKSVMYSDSIGKPNWFKSVGRQCNAANSSFNTDASRRST
jgi:hypothetical protein